MEYLINKGIRARITVRGGNIEVGKEYMCTLYRGVKDLDGRATVSATSILLPNKEGKDVPTCVFIFEPADTARLKAGIVILEVYDKGTLEQMSFVEKFATVRANSISA